jgi:hypothetical protein
LEEKMPAPRKSAQADPLPAVLSKYYSSFPALPDGIYLDLPAGRYHADSALGSSNLRDLLKGASLFWFKSILNPLRKPDKSTPAKVLGNAVHKLLLEGRGAYDAEYVRGPWAEGDDLTPAEKGALTKQAKKGLQEGQELIPADDYDFVLGCKSILDQDPELRGCLDNALTEVSVFWTRSDGVRMKARFDALKLRGIGDIKTIANERERELDVACRLDITTYRYDIPAAHYMAGRRQMAELIKEGSVYTWGVEAQEAGKIQSGSDSLAFLRNCAAFTEFAFQLVFIPKKGAPDAWSCTLSQGNPILDEAHTDITLAVENFKSAMVTDGLSSRWLPRRHVSELYREDLPMSFGRNARRP